MYLPLNLAALSSLPKPAILLADITPYKPETMQRLNALAETLQSRSMDSTTAKQQALAVLSQTVDMQSAVLSYADTFRVVGGFYARCRYFYYWGR